MDGSVGNAVSRGASTLRRAAVRLGSASALAAVVVGSTVTAAHAAVDPGLGYDPVTDKGSLYNVSEVVGAHQAYRQGITGKGIGVALIDTGVAAVPGLTSGNVVNGPDLSFDSQRPGLAHVDGFGHGTHLASIIAGRDAAGSPSSYLDATHFTGVAPDATLVNVKVGAANGAVDITQVIAGIDWVVEHAQDPGMNIRVINLSYGTDGTQSSTVDPLAYAVENAWKHGILVVVAGGNDGQADKTLANPALDPHLLAVGAMDDNGTVTSSDDTVPGWSTRGNTLRHVDVVAPGASVLGLRVPGGTADSDNPQARVGGRFAKASGTSQAAAVVSGEAALILQQSPWMTPDQVKQAVMGTASGIASTVPILGGNGLVDLRSILRNPLGAVLNTVTGLLGGLLQYGWGSGTGSLESARGDIHVVDGTSELAGERDVYGLPWNGSAWARATSGRSVWSYGTWRGEQLAGPSWLNGAWPTAAWSGTNWGGLSWSSDAWTARSWMGEDWTARSWMDAGWSARSWMGAGWF
jgi:serine protease AprX